MAALKVVLDFAKANRTAGCEAEGPEEWLPAVLTDALTAPTNQP